MSQLDLFGNEEEERRPLTVAEALTLSVIPFGESNAIKADEIQSMTGTQLEWRTQWPTREVIRDIVLAGYPICSSTRGFWRPTSRHEAMECADQLRARAMKILERATALKRGASSL